MRAPAVRHGELARAACGLILILSLLLCSALAEDSKLLPLGGLSDRQGFDAADFARRLITGENLVDLIQIERIPALLKRGLLDGLSELTLNLALPVLACVLLHMMTGTQNTGFMINLLCALCCGKALTQLWLGTQSDTGTLIDDILQAVNDMTPVMSSVAALTGGSFWASALVPASNLCASFIQQILKRGGFLLCEASTVIALSGAVAGRYALNRLFELLKSAAHGMLGIAVFLYGGLISAQGMISAARDGAAVRAAKVAMETLIPIIGGGISGAAGSLTVSVAMARSAVGITGVILIGRICLCPILKLGGRTLALKLLSAAMEPLADGTAATLIGHFGDILETLLAIVIACAVMTAMLPAAFAVLSGGIIQ